MKRTPQDLIYDHLAEVYRDPLTWKPVDTESWLRHRNIKNKIWDIVVGLLVSIGIFAVSLTILCGLFGCATHNFEVVRKEVVSRVDPISIQDQERFWTDVVFCAERALEEAERVNREIVNRAILGAVLGAATGAVYGSAFGKQYTGFGAHIGATSGALAGMNSVQNRYYTIMGNCLHNRGYLMLW